MKLAIRDREELFALKIEKVKPLYDEVLEVDERVLYQDGEFKVQKPLSPSNILSSILLKLENNMLVGLSKKIEG